ncbi:MAG: hypothetical protein RL322_41 [Pseudomonadota bacterium]|jgi:drug/metabolite transporter (DMT)-like permease
MADAHAQNDPDFGRLAYHSQHERYAGKPCPLPIVRSSPGVSAVSHHDPHGNRRGILFMVLAMATFVGNDILVKLASESLSSSQLIFIRGLFATTWVLLYARATGVSVSPRMLSGRWVGGRAIVDAASTFAYLIALFHMPLANAIAINMAAPLMLTVIAVVFLRERVDLRHGLAVVIGFIGVILIVQPASEGFNAFSLLCLFATLLHCVRDLMTRRIPGAVPSIVVTFSSAAAVTVFAGVGTLASGWQAPSASTLLTIAAASVFLAIGYLMITLAMRTGDLSVVAPFRYSGLPIALLFGWLVWDDVPNLAAWIGIVLLCAAGLYLLSVARPRRLARPDPSGRPVDVDQS